MLRRTHNSTIGGQAATTLPGRTEHFANLTFTDQEKTIYTSMENADRVLLKKWYDEGEG